MHTCHNVFAASIVFPSKAGVGRVGGVEHMCAELILTISWDAAGSAKHPQLVSACVKDGAGGGGGPASDDEGAEGGVGGEGGDHKEAEEEEEGGKKERRQCLPVHFWGGGQWTTSKVHSHRFENSTVVLSTSSIEFI